MAGADADDEEGAFEADVSVFVMTLNEEVNIARCLESVRWSNDVVVLDSFSTDRTVGLARAFPNVRVLQHRFEDYGSQRNHGLHGIRYRNTWLLVVDADEIVEPELAVEVRRIAGRGPAVSANVFLLRRKVFIEDGWVRRNVSSGFWIERFMRPAAVRYEGIVHERLKFEGKPGRLQGALQHHQFRKGVDDWLARRCRYAWLEAQSMALAPFRPLQLLSRNVLVRRAALKALFYRLPARWLVYLLYNLVFKCAYLDGKAGIRYVLLEAYSLHLGARQAKERRSVQASEARSAADL